jgi:cytochrome b pre-mRNA-processing protein 3
MHDPGDDAELARRVAEQFVTDMDAAFREMGIGDLSVPKRMMTLYRSFGGRIGAYKAGIEAGEAALADAIARNVFPDGKEDRHALALTAYLRSAVAALRAADLAALRRGQVPFPYPSPPGEEELVP